MAKVIRMLVSMAGAEESYAYGDLLTVSDTIADAWVEANIAEIHVEQAQKVKEHIPVIAPYEPPDEPPPAADPAPDDVVEVEPEPEPASKPTKRRR